MSEQQSSYRQIMKATSLFGGVQVFNIIIQVIRSKFVAILLGPGGMGIMGLLNSTIGLISSLTNFGLGTSAVKDIASAESTGSKRQIGITITVLRQMVWITGLLGSLVTGIFSSLLSQLTFGNNDYRLAFVWISITLLFNQLTSGQLVVLQGLRKLQYLAKANVLGSFVGLLITVPMYYFWGKQGIAPGIIATALISLAMSLYFARKVEFEKVNLSIKQSVKQGRSMLQMGFMISLSGLFLVAVSYIVRIFIGRKGGVEQVGLYNAGFAIINTYVGLIFNAMGTDYYPRLSAIANDNKLCKQAINQQAEIALLVLAPILIIFLIFINGLIILLYSKQFLGVNDMIHWAALGMFFKAASWSIAFIFLAKGNSKLFFMVELISNVLLLGFNILGYNIGGLTGLGVSFTVYYLFYFIFVYSISKTKYTFDIEPKLASIFVIQFGLAVLGFLTMRYATTPYNYMIGTLLIGISFWFSYEELDKRLGLRSIIQGFKEKYRL